MSILGCGCKRSCTLFAVIASIVVGILVALLTVTGIIVVAPAALIVAFGIAVVYLALVLAVVAFRRRHDTDCCLCSTLGTVLTGILGTAATAALLLGVAFPATSILGAIVTGLLGAGVTLTLTATACFAKCLAECAD